MAFEWINKKWSPNAKDHINDRKDIICDTEDDVSTLPESAPGSTALVVATGNVYVVNASRQWVEFGTGVVVPTGGGGSDTLTWDGNTDGLAAAGGMFYKVSDVAPTLEELGTESIVIRSDDKQYYPSAFMEIANGVFVHDNFGVVIVLASGVGVDANGMTFTEAGTYFYNAEGTYTVSLTIPGYTDF